MKIDWDYLQPVQAPPELPDGLFWGKNGFLQANCCCCDKPTDWDGEIHEYDGRAWCGGSPRCCP